MDWEESMPTAKATRDQVVRFAESLMRGEPNREKIALTVVSGKVHVLV
jgi:hypothetical protein